MEGTRVDQDFSQRVKERLNLIARFHQVQESMNARAKDHPGTNGVRHLSCHPLKYIPRGPIHVRPEKQSHKELMLGKGPGKHPSNQQDGGQSIVPGGKLAKQRTKLCGSEKASVRREQYDGHPMRRAGSQQVYSAVSTLRQLESCVKREDNGQGQRL